MMQRLLSFLLLVLIIGASGTVGYAVGQAREANTTINIHRYDRVVPLDELLPLLIDPPAIAPEQRQDMLPNGFINKNREFSAYRCFLLSLAV